MATSYTAGFATLLVLSVIIGSFASPGHVHTKHVIHAPLHIKMIHHHKIVKVPVVFRKHLHHHKHLSHENVYIPLKEKPKPVYEDDDGGDDHHPTITIYKTVYQGGDSGEGSGGNGGGQGGGHGGGYGGGQGGGHGGGYGGGQGGGQGGGYRHYYSQIGDNENYSSGPDRSEDDNSYEYEESQEQPSSYSTYSFRGPH